jgi:hypothetical protein
MTDEPERRATQNPLDVAGVLAVLYTTGYLGMVGMLFFIEIPLTNKEPLLQLFGLMSAIQMALIAFYFGSSKSGEASQRAIEQSKGRSDAVVQAIAQTVPVAAAAAAAAPVLPAVPAVQPTKENTDGKPAS